MGDEYIDKLIELLRENNKQQENSRRESTLLMKEQTGAIVKMSTMIENLDRVLQTKPCIVKPKTEKLEQGWRDSSVTTYKWIIGSLIGLIIGILTSVGLYSTHIIVK
jgi:TctA family transporter